MDKTNKNLVLNNQIDRADYPIAFFDGECVMCNGFVDLMVKIDRQGIIKISPLQGETAKQYLPPLPLDRKDWSIYYLDNSKLYSQSDAFIQICKRLGGILFVFSLIEIIPQNIRDSIYRVIAENRYKLLGKRSTCRVPTEAEKERFLP